MDQKPVVNQRVFFFTQEYRTLRPKISTPPKKVSRFCLAPPLRHKRNRRGSRRDAPCGRPVILAQNHIGAANIFPVSQEKSVISGEITVDGRKGRPYEQDR